MIDMELIDVIMEKEVGHNSGIFSVALQGMLEDMKLLNTPEIRVLRLALLARLECYSILWTRYVAFLQGTIDPSIYPEISSEAEELAFATFDEHILEVAKLGQAKGLTDSEFLVLCRGE